jgi:hypothetical protein
MTAIEVAKAVHEAQGNEEALVPVEGAQESLEIDARIVVRNAEGLMDLYLDAMCRTGRDATALDRGAKGMMDLGVVVVLLRLCEVIEEMIVGKAIDRVAGVVEEVHRWKIEENLSVIEPVAEFRIEETLIVIEPAAEVRIEGSRIAIEPVEEFKIEEKRIVIDPASEVGEAKVAWKSEGTIGEVIEADVIGDRNSLTSSRAVCEPIEDESCCESLIQHLDLLCNRSLTVFW